MSETPTRGAPAGLRPFVCGAIGLVLFGLVHLVAIRASFRPPATSEEASLRRAMQAFRVEIGGLEPSAWGAMQVLNTGFSLLLLQAGVLSLMAVRPAVASGRLRALTLANTAFAAALLVPSVVYLVPPPMVFSGAVLALFVASLVRQVKARP